MALSTVISGSQVKRFMSDFTVEYINANQFAKETGTDGNKVVIVKNQEGAVKTMSIPFIGKSTGGGVTGDTALEGNETALANHEHTLTLTTKRKAIARTQNQQDSSVIDMLNAGRRVLMDFAMDDLRSSIVTALGSIDGVAYGSATEGNKDEWLANNSDYALFGAAVGNNASNDHSAALAQIDNTADKLTSAMGSLAKRRALSTTSRKQRPIRVMNDEKWMIMYCNSLCFRDLQLDTALVNATREAWSRGPSNPLFTGGDLIKDGIIYREVEDIAVVSGVGATGIDVAPNYLCGAGAVGVGYGRQPYPIQEVRDYGFVQGVGIAMYRGIEKLQFEDGTAGKIDNGVSVVWAAAVADA